MISRFLKAWFGDFSKEELKKFLKLGLMFGVIIGVYWTLRPLKDSLFQDLVGAQYQPWAKWLSMVVLFPIVILYSKLVERLSRRNLFFLLSTVYCVLSILFGVLMSLPSIGLDSGAPSVYNLLGWAWYVFVESFGSLMVALFWAFTTDITTAESGKRGFSLVVMIGQLGGVFIPLILPRLPKLTNNFITDPMVLGIAGLVIFTIIPLVSYFLATTPADQLKGFGEKEPESENVPADNTQSEDSKKGEPGFLEGLKLMLSEPYLLGIFGIITFFEVIVTIFDYHFKTMAKSELVDRALVTDLFSQYGSYANLVTFFCLFFGISNITRRLGVTTALSIMPFIVAGGIAIMYFNTTLTALFWIMVAAKGINYALNGPAMKQLYIPVSDDARYKSQAWIETFGSRGSKAAGGGINMLHRTLAIRLNGPQWANFSSVQGLMYKAGDLGSYWHIALTSYLFFGICGIWLIVALYLGRTYQKAVDNNKIVC